MCVIDICIGLKTIQRSCLWYKLMYFGMKAKMLDVIKSLYNYENCTFQANNCLIALSLKYEMILNKV